MKDIYDRYKEILTITTISSILYFCGYLSSDYHNKILGIKINYQALDIIKWGADFFIYSIIDFLNNISTIGKDWIKLEFILGIVYFVICLFIINKKYLSLLFSIYILLLSAYFLFFFIGKADLNLLKLIKLDNLNVIYTYFIVLNIFNIINIFSLKSESNKKYFLIIPILFLPALYGVYGRNYNFNCTQKNLTVTTILIESYDGKNYTMEKIYKCDTLTIVNKNCYDIKYQYKIDKSENYNLTFEKINFFEFIKDRYNGN